MRNSVCNLKGVLEEIILQITISPQETLQLVTFPKHKTQDEVTRMKTKIGKRRGLRVNISGGGGGGGSK